ncbi:hypothetical protein ABPG75_000197 [Micractinium tetrahymenae]
MADLSETERLHRENSTLVQQNRCYRDRIASLSKKVDGLEQQMEAEGGESGEELEQLRHEKQELARQMSGLRRRLEEAQAGGGFGASVAALKKEVAEQRQTHANLEVHYHSLYGRATAFKGRAETAERWVQQLQLQLEQAQRQLATAAAEPSTGGSAQQLEQAQAELAEVREQKEALRMEYEQERQLLAARLAAFQQQQQAMQEEELEGGAAGQEASDARVEELERELACLRHDFGRLSAQLEVATESTAHAWHKQNLSKLINSQRQLQGQLKGMLGDLHSLPERVEHARSIQEVAAYVRALCDKYPCVEPAQLLPRQQTCRLSLQRRQSAWRRAGQLCTVRRAGLLRQRQQQLRHKVRLAAR